MRRKHTSTTSIITPLLLLLTPTLVTSFAFPGAPWPFEQRARDVNTSPVIAKYWPGDSKPDEQTIQHLKRREHIKRSNAAPLELIYGHSLKKMPSDESEKFFDSYWEPISPVPFPPAYPQPDSISDDSRPLLHKRGSTAPSSGEEGEPQKQQPFQPPYKHHIPPSLLFKRQFVCPDNHYPCTSISAPAFCCRSDQRCERVEDTGFGSVACCPNGQKCTGGLNSCSEDQTACPEEHGGGCCVLGYRCSSEGCVPDNGGAPSPTTTVEGAQTTEACSNGFYACPSSLAGGCCPIGRACDVNNCPESTGNPGPAPPVTTGDTCPTGYYTCAARFNGGCCRIGRDCALTHCPARDTGTTGNAFEPTSYDEKASPTTNVPPGPVGSCAPGWFTCPPSFNGGCCPQNYDCGLTNCPAKTLNGGQPNALPNESKMAPIPTDIPIGGAPGVRMGGGVDGVRKVVVVVAVVVLVGVVV